MVTTDAADSARRANPPGNNPTVFFDGGCPLCRREITHYRKLDRARALRWQDIAADPDAPGAAGITWQDAMRRLHVIDSYGALRSGVPAFMVIWSVLPGYRWLARGVRSVPGLERALDGVYRVFADWRWRRRCRGGGCATR